MGRLFGTDGIRGVANVELTPLIAVALGRAVAQRLVPPGGSIALGQDTRRSCDMLAAAIVAGATSAGADVARLGIVPTPALAHVTGAGDFDAGVMVSASHNPADDNGLKVLDSNGVKLPDALEDELEALMASGGDGPVRTNGQLGREVAAGDLLDLYVMERVRLASGIGARSRVVVDCANGSAGRTAPEILGATGATVDVIFDAPDGTNINDGCGATAPDALAAEVVARGADIGFALDGDGDRCIAVDHRGEIVDGDRIMGILALDRMARSALPGSVLVATVLSNGGLEAAVTGAGGRVVRTPVGDRYIVEAMTAEGAALGGEKSGHVIVRDHASTGDGTLTALMILDVLARSGRTLAELAADIELYPQVQRNVLVRQRDGWESDPMLRTAIIEAERQLAGRGRVLVRPSGTEPALRVMVEGADPELVAALADRIATLAEERLH
jgi:phosphoglucosamine mutase